MKNPERKFIMEFENYPTLVGMKHYDLKEARGVAEEIAMQENIINKIKHRPIVKVLGVTEEI